MLPRLAAIVPALAVLGVAAAPLAAHEDHAHDDHAQEASRELDAHVHGVSTLEIAAEGSIVEMNLLSPGMDIVGFEYEASTDADKDAVEAAIRTMLLPENLVTLPEAAECRLTEVLAHLHSGDHDHDEGDAHGHGEEAAREDHAAGEDHADGDGGEHSEFHARYIFDCAHPDELTTVGFPFFERFENAEEIEAQFVTQSGAGSAEIGRDAPELKLN